MYGIRFVDVLKPTDTGVIYKSQLIAQNYQDMNGRFIPTKALTISKLGQRIGFTMAATRTDTEVYARDITEAYVQSRSCLERKIFLKPPSEMKLPDQKILLALKPLYGQPEAGQHWFFTYSEQHKRELEMQSSTTDKCVLYCASTSSPLLDVVILQVDDSYEIGNKEFLDQQNASTDQFRTKPRKFLKPGGSCLFNGYCIEQEEYGSVRMQQKKKGE